MTTVYDRKYSNKIQFSNSPCSSFLIVTAAPLFVDRNIVKRTLLKTHYLLFKISKFFLQMDNIEIKMHLLCSIPSCISVLPVGEM